MGSSLYNIVETRLNVLTGALVLPWQIGMCTSILVADSGCVCSIHMTLFTIPHELDIYA